LAVPAVFSCSTQAPTPVSEASVSSHIGNGDSWWIGFIIWLCAAASLTLSMARSFVAVDTNSAVSVSQVRGAVIDTKCGINWLM